MILPLSNFRNSQQRCSIKRCYWKLRKKFAGKHLCQSFIFNKVAGCNPATLFKKRLWYRCFQVNFGNFLRTLFIEHLRATASEILGWVFFKRFVSYVQNILFQKIISSCLLYIKKKINQKLLNQHCKLFHLNSVLL